jgi:hypothetical protein
VSGGAVLREETWIVWMVLEKTFADRHVVVKRLEEATAFCHCSHQLYFSLESRDFEIVVENPPVRENSFAIYQPVACSTEPMCPLTVEEVSDFGEGID